MVVEAKLIGALPASLRNWLKLAQRDEGGSVLHPHLSLPKTFNDSFATGLARPAAEKFAGAWLACFLVMARGGLWHRWRSSRRCPANADGSDD